MNSKKQEKRSDGDLRTDIWTTLQELETPSAFAFSAVKWSLPNPGICVPSLGVLGLPLSTDNAQKLISIASQSPFGKGEQTIVDTSVRKSFELNSNQFSLENPDWSKVMRKILDTVVTGLGLKKGMGKVSAELYKLLLYPQGAFFRAHRDSEKAPGMFATLVFCLPSPHEGGKLILTQGNDKYEFETAGSSAFRTSYAAWFADITHEVTPIMSGYRLVLTYNLIRQTDFEVPSYNLARGRVQELSTLLELYNSRLEAGDNTLPSILLHKLKHKYTQTNLKLQALKPNDLAQVSTLAQLATKLGFEIFLATLELEVRTDEECSDYEEKDHWVQNMVDLDGNLIENCFEYSEGALTDSTPQDAGKPDETECEGHTGNEGCPVTQWYRDTVVVIVPHSKRIDFVFESDENGTVIKPLFDKLMQEFSEDPAQKPWLEELCKKALKDDIHDPDSIPSWFQKAADTALDLGRFDLYDKACEKTNDKIMLKAPSLLGRWAVSNGVTAMSDRLMKGVKTASSVTEKVSFLKSVADGFEAAIHEGSTEKATLKQWSDEAILTAVSEMTTLTKDDAKSLAQLCTTMDWGLYEMKVTPVVLKGATAIKISFMNEFMSTPPQDPVTEQRSFIEKIILDIWNKFAFDSTPNDLIEKDLLRIIENSVKILSSECVEKTMIPAMLRAIPDASKECVEKLFISFARMILKTEPVGFKLETNDPPLSHKRLVQALLTKYLKENVGLKPKAPTNWSLPTRSCNCKDCSVVNRFLQSPVETILKFPCSKPRRYHLHQNFTNWGNQGSYDVTTLRDSNPNVWQITKHQNGYESAKSDWIKSVETAVKTLSELENDEPVAGRLQSYLQPYYNVIMNAAVKQLPDLNSLLGSSRLSENIENESSTSNQSNNQTARKRGAGKVSLASKRSRSSN